MPKQAFDVSVSEYSVNGLAVFGTIRCCALPIGAYVSLVGGMGSQLAKSGTLA